MQTNLVDKYKNSAQGQEADQILRSCVHCGFCTATCPTYQLLGDELDGPRGRIYLMKQVFEGKEVTKKTQAHLDRCLTCRACETTCPSGVQYGRLVDIGRHIVEQKVGRTLLEKVQRKALRSIVPNPKKFSMLLGLGRTFKPVLPSAVKAKIPAKQNSPTWPVVNHDRKMLVLDGCVQPLTAPATNAATATVLDKIGIELIRVQNATCCGAVSHHLSAHEEGLNFMRRNIDAWWPQMENGIEAIVMTASGCGVVVKDYGKLLEHDSQYAEKAKKISSLTKDISEVLIKEDLTPLMKTTKRQKVAFHSPCTLQHGQKLSGVVETLLNKVGYELTNIVDSHLCCGSAGTYSILQSKLSKQLLENKLNSLQSESPDVIATANIGCQMHMETKAKIPIKHWIELLLD